MYSKKEVIYSSTMGLCLVKDVVKLSPDRSTPVTYYVLRSFYDKEKIAYIPVEDHAVDLRYPLERSEAEEEFKELIKDHSGEERPDLTPASAGIVRDDFREQLLNRLGEVAYVLGMDIGTIEEKIWGTDEQRS